MGGRGGEGWFKNEPKTTSLLSTASFLMDDFIPGPHGLASRAPACSASILREGNHNTGFLFSIFMPAGRRTSETFSLMFPGHSEFGPVQRLEW